MLIEGVYHWRAKPVAFRNDYCISCRGERLAIQVRTIDVFHVFWIPVLPLGVYRRWWCTECGSRPDLSRTARRSIKVLAAVVATLMAPAFWLAPVPPEDEATFWFLRAGFALLSIAAWWWVARGSDDVERRQHLARIAPNQATECPFCKIALRHEEPPSCIRCGIVRTRLGAPSRPAN
jgi:hypothetical protein